MRYGIFLMALMVTGCGQEGATLPLGENGDPAVPTAQQSRNPVQNTWYKADPTDSQIMLRNAKPGEETEFQMITVDTAPYTCIAGRAVVNPTDRETGTITIGYFGAYAEEASGYVPPMPPASYTACENAKATHQGTWNYEIVDDRIRFWKDDIGTDNFAQLLVEPTVYCYGTNCP